MKYMFEVVVSIGMCVSSSAIGAELSSNRLLQLCHLEDPSCVPLLKKIYKESLAHPYLQRYGQGPEVRVLCPRGKVPTWQEAAWDFFNELENLPEMVNFPARISMTEGMEWEMPCP